MTIKREASFHEAAHAVLANLSKYHAIVGDINLQNYGAGEIFISLSKSKCAAGGKPQDASAQKDKDVAKDLAVVLCGGFAAEKIAAKIDASLNPNEQCATPDYQLAEQQLQMAGLSKKYDVYQAQANQILEANWKAVETLANYLFANTSADPQQILDIINGT